MAEDPINQRASRFVISLCQEGISIVGVRSRSPSNPGFHISRTCTIYATTPTQCSPPNKQAEKLFATWVMGDLWLQVFKDVDLDVDDEPLDVIAVIKWVSSKIKGCREEVKAYENRQSLDIVYRFELIPEAFWFVLSFLQ